jgi:hypothetical protein
MLVCKLINLRECNAGLKELQNDFSRPQQRIRTPVVMARWGDPLQPSATKLGS